MSNTGDYNSGDYNSGHWNSGHSNSGNDNSGHRNSGQWNSGNRNSGNSNSGHRNSGNSNSGHWNSGHWNSGAFNRDAPKMRLFEKELDMTVDEFYKKYSLSVDLPTCRWIDKQKMTEEEKSNNSGWETTGGYLRTLEYKEACKLWWSENPKDHERFLGLPGFDAEIFNDITGIDVNAEEEVEVTANGKTVKISRKSAKSLGLVD